MKIEEYVRPEVWCDATNIVQVVVAAIVPFFNYLGVFETVFVEDAIEGSRFNVIDSNEIAWPGILP
jgi:hypothetical protein